VGSLPKGASPYGVMDMVGNVAQWTGSDAAPKDAERNWAWYVVKGAARVHTQRYNFLCAARNFSAHNSRWHDWLGFRCAMDAEGTEGAGAMNGAPTSGAMNRAPTLGRDESRPYMGGGAPKRPEMPGPDEGAVGRPIEMVCAGPGATIRVPWFPRGYFGLSFPEQIGAEGLPLGWGVQHSGFRPVNEGGVVGYDCTFEGKAELRARLKGGVDYVDFTLTLRNLTDRAFTNVHSNTCFNCWQSPYFDDPERVRSFVWTDEGPTCFLRMPHGGGGEPLHNGWTVAKPGEPAPVGGDRVHYPIIALRSRDGKWMVAQTYDQGVTVASNAHYACLHSRPTWPDIPPGETVSRTGRLYFIRGGVEELLARWKADVGE